LSISDQIDKITIVNKKVRVRIAPSPTGVPHIGNTRTALFNWLFVRHHHGEFVVRIEDTDRERLIPESQEKILEILEWLGLTWDEGPKVGGDFKPYIQSERVDIYKKHVDELIQKGVAYEDEGAVRFKIEKGRDISWVDLIHGEVKFKSDVVEDFVILKSDGFPTYHLASVVDDHLMEISHVLRGDEWVSSTPKHILLYEAFGWEPPEFGHLPLILGSDKAKLSKRHGAQSALEYRDLGYLPEALFNFLLLLGWAPIGEKEIFTAEEAIEAFDLDRINKTNPIFNLDKLNWFNGQYLRLLPDTELAEKLTNFIPKNWDKEDVKKLIPIVKDRLTTLGDFVSLVDWYFDSEIEIDNKLLIGKDQTVNSTKKMLDAARKRMESLGVWNHDNLESSMRALASELNTKPGDLFMALRIALTGKTVTPPLFETMIVLGEDEVLKRTQYARDQL